MSPTHCSKDLQLDTVPPRQHLIGRHSPVGHLKSLRKSICSRQLIASAGLMKEQRGDPVEDQCPSLDRLAAAVQPNKRSPENDHNNNNDTCSSSDEKYVNESAAAAVLLSLHGARPVGTVEETAGDRAAKDSYHTEPRGTKEAVAKPCSRVSKVRLTSLSSEDDNVDAAGYASALSPSDDDKPAQSYISLIANAILSTTDKRLVLSDIYTYVLQKFSYFRNKGPGWRNSIRHNLSLNECFVKAGRSPNGKGHFWAINPANFDDFSKGDFRRRRAQRRARKAMLLHYTTHQFGPTVPDGGRTMLSSPTTPGSYRPLPHAVMEASWYTPYGHRFPSERLPPSASVDDRKLLFMKPPVLTSAKPTAKKTAFDMESLLKKDDPPPVSSAVPPPPSSTGLPCGMQWRESTKDTAYRAMDAMFRGSVPLDGGRFTVCCDGVHCPDWSASDPHYDGLRFHGMPPRARKSLPIPFAISPSAESMAQASAIARFERFGLTPAFPMSPGLLPFEHYRSSR